jgi:hypothetical protein
MKQCSQRFVAGCLLLAGWLFHAGGAAAQTEYSLPPLPQVESTPSKLIVAPYLWALNISGNVQLGGQSVPLTVPAAQLARGAQSGGMGYIQVPIGNNFLYLDGLGAGFHERNFQPFFDQTVGAHLYMGEAGAGHNFSVATDFPVSGETVISPYIGARYITLYVKVEGPLVEQSAGQTCYEPVAGVFVEGPIFHRLNYVVKVDAGGFNIGNTNYVNGLIVFTYNITRHIAIGAGYRAAHFYAGPVPGNGLAMNLTATGPLAGIEITF